MRLSDLKCLLEIIFTLGWISKQDIVTNRGGKQGCILECHGNQGSKFTAGHISNVDAIDLDSATGDLIESGAQRSQCGLAATGETNERNRLTGL